MKPSPTKDGFSIQLRYGQGRRERFTIACADRTEAERRAGIMTDLARLLVESGRLEEAPLALERLAELRDGRAFAGAAQGIRELCAEPLPEAESAAFDAKMTFRRFGQLWTSGKLHERWPDKFPIKKSVAQDISRLEYLYRSVGSVPIGAFTIAHADKAMQSLPAKVRTGATRRQYAQIIAFLLGRAAYPCRLIPATPIVKGFLPPVSQPPKFPFLYPSEDLQLMRCTDVEMGLRLLYGFTTREGGRKGETRLTWNCFDLERGHIAIPPTKTGEVREWDLFPGTAEALAAYKRGLGTPKPTDFVFPEVSETEEAVRLRAMLRVAGVQREALYQASPGRGALRFHDLRASFVTIALAMGRSEAWITERTGHTTSQMIYRYKRPIAAKLGDWTPLHVALGFAEADDQWVAHEVARNISHDAGGDAEVVEITVANRARPAGFEPATSGLEIPAQTAGTPLHREKHRGSCTTDSVEGLSVPPQDRGGGTQTQAHAFTGAELQELLELSQRAKRWHLVKALGEQLEAMAAAEPTNVTRIDSRRRS